MMSRRISTLSRREFLLRLGISAATIPFLPRFIFDPILAETGPGALPFFGVFWLPHGGDHGAVFRPNDSQLQPRPIFGVNQIESAAQVMANFPIKGGLLSNYLRSDGSLNGAFGPLWNTEGLIPYLNLINSLDVMRYYGHGNVATGGTAEVNGKFAMWRSIDQAIFQSSVYQPRNPVSLVWLGDSGLSQAGNIASDLNSSLRAVNGDYQPLSLFNKLFNGLTPSSAGSGNRKALDDVVTDINRLKQSSLVSNENRAALDLHASRLNDIKQSLLSGQNCTTYSPTPSFSTNGVTLAQQFADILAFAASSCTRPIVFMCEASGFASAPGGSDYFHANVMHVVSNENPGIQVTEAERRVLLAEKIVPYYRDQLSRIVFEVAKKFKNTPTSGGSNLLRDSLILGVPESGDRTHSEYGLSAFTLGKAAKARGWRSGYHLDFLDRRERRKTSNNQPLTDPLLDQSVYLGLPYVNFLNTLAEAAGITPSSYAPNGNGYGVFSNGGFNGPVTTRPAIPKSLVVDWLLNSG